MPLKKIFLLQVILLIVCHVLHMNATEEDKKTSVLYGGIQAFRNETKVRQELSVINNSLHYSSQKTGVSVAVGCEIPLLSGSYNVSAVFGE